MCGHQGKLQSDRQTDRQTDNSHDTVPTVLGGQIS